MDKRLLQTYSVWAKDNLEKQVEISLKTLGINGDKDIKPARKVGDYTVIEGDPNSYPASLLSNRRQIIEMIKANGYKNVIEEFAYTWFNRIIALRFMEVHDFLNHGFRVLSNRNGGIEPEILKNVGLVKFDLGLDAAYCGKLRDEGKIEELFRYVLLKQCNALSGILPMLFSKEGDYTELLLPKTLLKGDTVITKLLEIPEEAFLEDVEVLGWLYQFYVADRRQEYREAKLVTKNMIPTLTQVFTPDWIVRYMAENSVGRIWLESYPNSSLRSEMKYFVEDAKQTEEVQRKIDAIKYCNVNPEDIRIIEPCCGSGHILVYVFDLLFKMYEEKGYQKRDIPTLILKKNLTGLEIDKRAAQLAAFSLVMKARSINNQFFSEKYYVLPRVYEFYESHPLDLMGYQNALRETGVIADSDVKELTELVSSFKNGKTVGSLLKVKPMNFDHMEEVVSKIEREVVLGIFNQEFISIGLPIIKNMIALGRALATKYDVMITNPPYLGISKIESAAKEYLIASYPDSKSDMFAMFIEVPFVKQNGFRAIVNPDSWMFLTVFEELRKDVLRNNDIVSMIHLGLGAFDATVQTVAFVLRQSNVNYRGRYFRLNKIKEKESGFLNHINEVVSDKQRYKTIPGFPIAFWISDGLINSFIKGHPIEGIGSVRTGMSTGKNDLYLRLWHEVENGKISFRATDINQIDLSQKPWIPYNKGGDARKWYGNNEYIVLWREHDHFHRSRPNFQDIYLKEGLTWSFVTTGMFSARFYDIGHLWDVAGSPCVFKRRSDLLYVLAFLSTKIAAEIMKLINPTLNCQVVDIQRVPIISNTSKENEINAISEKSIAISRSDWDSFETSWDFLEHPLVRLRKGLGDSTAVSATMFRYYGGHPKVSSPVELCYMLWQGECRDRFNKLKTNEEELNRIFIEIYGLQGELTPEVEGNDVTVRLADKERDIKSLISYLVGIIMGRYSLDVEGLAYAGGEWDASKYITYQPDNDGIVPIYTDLGMKDGLDTRIIELLKLVYGTDTYRENIDFIAEALGKKNSESSEETLNRYLNDGFYADHLKIYQKRPIYWMFSSGKNSGFKCLIYMHRYNSDTLARINGKYFLPESTRLKNELDELLATIEGSEGRDRIRLEKDRQRLADKYREAIEYGQVLDHMANKYISIDLDDGVKVNYAKFQGVELVTDNGTKVKKDLLVPIK